MPACESGGVWHPHLMARQVSRVDGGTRELLVALDQETVAHSNVQRVRGDVIPIGTPRLHYYSLDSLFLFLPTLSTETCGGLASLTAIFTGLVTAAKTGVRPRA